MPDTNGYLTRAEMEAVLNSGGSVFHGGSHYLTLASLPGEVDLAKGDVEREARAKEALLAQRDALQAQIDRLDAEHTGMTVATETQSSADDAANEAMNTAPARRGRPSTVEAPAV